MDKRRKWNLLVIPNSPSENIVSSSIQHSIQNKRKEHSIKKYRRSRIPIVDTSASDNGKLSILLNLWKEVLYYILKIFFSVT